MNTRSLMRLRGLLRKEVLQIRRDPSSILLAIVMPVVLLFLFGFGVSLDAEHIRLAIVREDASQVARDLEARFHLSRSFAPVAADSFRAAESLLRSGEADGILTIRDDLAKGLAGTTASPALQLVVDAADSTRANAIIQYVKGTVATMGTLRAARQEGAPPPGLRVETRMWFNEAVDSTNFLVPGLLTLIMTLIGVLLTALVIAREWERGTMEAILATPLRPGELIVGKIVPYFGLGLLGMLTSVGLARLVFDVPFAGSFVALLVTGSLFLLASLGIGLLISAVVRIQFVAAQVSLVVGFLPAFFLSGLLFDLGSTPWPVQWISHVLPARYFVQIGQTLFLAGDVREILVTNGLVLLGMASALLLGVRRKLGIRWEAT